MDKAIAKEERQLNVLEKTIEKDITKFEEFLKENEKKSVEARTLYVQLTHKMFVEIPVK